MTTENTPYANIPGLHTKPFAPTGGVTFYPDSHSEVHYSHMQAVVNEDNQLDVSIFTYSCGIDSDGRQQGNSFREEQHSGWNNISLDKAVKLLKKWEAEQEKGHIEPYDGELLCKQENRPILNPLSDENITELRKTLATNRQSPKTITGKKELVSEKGLERVFNYLSAQKNEQTGLYTVMDTRETQKSRNKLTAFFNNYRTRRRIGHSVAHDLSLEEAKIKVKAGLPKQSRG